MLKGIRLTIIDENHAKAELNLPNNWLGFGTFLVIGAIIMGVGIWSQLSFGGGWELLIITGVVWFFGYILYVYQNSLDIDKLEGKVTQRRTIGVLYNKVRGVWAIERIQGFEARMLSFYADVLNETAMARELAAGTVDAIMPGSGADDVKYWQDHSTYETRVERGALLLKLKSGEIIHALVLRFAKKPENVAKNLNLFLEGKYKEPGIIED
jgi:hypothetical protein